MDANVQRALNDKLYDKRKVGALESVFYLPFCCPPAAVDPLTMLPDSNVSFVSSLRPRTTTGSLPFLTSSVTSMHMLFTNLTRGMEVSSAWPLPP